MSKIIIVGPAYPFRGGIATFNERLAREFINLGHEVAIYTFSLQYPKMFFPGKTQYSESTPPDDITILQTISSVSPMSWIKTSKQIRDEKPDFVIFRFWIPFMAPCLGSIARLVSKKSTIKVIGLVDNALPHESRPGDKMLTKYFTDSIDGFMVMSQSVKTDLNKFTQKPIALSPHPLYDNFGKNLDKNQARESLNLPKNGFIFLFFGFIRRYKGLDLLIEAFNLLSKSEKAYLLIAGEYYSDEEEIKNLIQSSPVKNNIIEHTHFIKNEDVAQYFSTADVVVQPYRNATQSGVTPLAYHFEVPMIVTRVGALSEQVPETIGLVCEPTVQDISVAMGKMMQLDLIRFIQGIREEKSKLSWDYFAEAVLKLAESLD